MKVAILDMQPIEPAVGGGRLRLLGLYHGLGPGVQATYVGTYDWPGPGYRRHMLSGNLEEINIPLTGAHFQAAEEAKQRAGGKNVIDCVFHLQAHLSPDYVAQARLVARDADVVIFSHPWIFPLTRDVLDFSRQLIVYDSHNVEGALRYDLLKDHPGGVEVAKEVISVERSLCEAADLILACSLEDGRKFTEFYGASPDRIRLTPNGVFVGGIAPADPATKSAARKACKLGGNPVAIFIGSAYAPNQEAARFIASWLAPALPEVVFVIAGGVGDQLRAELRGKAPKNVVIAGQIDEKRKKELLLASDLALNPMFSGSGTNIKMFDFMAAGLPTVATPVGARGVATSLKSFVTCSSEEMAQVVKALIKDLPRRQELSANARLDAERNYAWEQISRNLGALLCRSAAAKQQKRQAPFFSVIIPTFERPQSLTRVLDLLSLQSERDFEVIVVDQSASPWPGQNLDFDLDLYYVHSDVRGAVRARNFGAMLARGNVLAFLDDDCEPSLRWLEFATRQFGAPDVVGLEGLVESSRLQDSDWRPVSNRGIIGLGFMTANLFVRRPTFYQLGGFDISFDDPHFREDTDFGWRLQELGQVPFSSQAWVYHPPHSRKKARESQSARDRFFEKDALLLQKHPTRYRQLLMAEGHWRHTDGFWPNFLRGATKRGVDIPEEILRLAPPELRENFYSVGRMEASP